MVAVAHLLSAPSRRLVVVRSAPLPHRPRRAVSVATFQRRRIVAAGVVVAAVLGISLVVQASSGRAGAGPHADAGAATQVERVYVVQPGDSFWGIAQALQPGGDPRPLVARMVASHGSPVLMVGERISLPAAA